MRTDKSGGLIAQRPCIRCLVSIAQYVCAACS